MAIRLYIKRGNMETKIVDFYKDKENYYKAIDVLKSNRSIVFPTETVYGIGANALNREAILKIFEIKNRAKDNPLIVHINDFDISMYAKDIFKNTYKLIDKFWPGPLTIILKKKDIIPDEVTAGRDTVALRFPNHEIALDIINRTGFPIAAPSANISGRPSGTNAMRCFEDLYGKVEFIVDGSQSEIGLESTVINMVDDQGVILRPGYLTLDKIREVLPNAYISHQVSEKFVGDKPLSPGLKYKHYAPKADMVIVKSSIFKLVDYIRDKSHFYKKIGVLCSCENFEYYQDLKNNLCIDLEIIVAGSVNKFIEISRNLFESIRKFDDLKCDFIISECFYDDFSNAVMNRLLKASSHNVIIL